MARVVSMAKKSASRKTNLDLKEFNAFLILVTKESDRGMVLVTGALLEDLLGRCIRCFLLDHPRVDELLERALGTPWARARMAFLLGILSEDEYQECERVRVVRNAFAHDIACDFETEEVERICSSFVLVSNPKTKGTDAKNQYLLAAIGLLASLSGRPANLTKRRLKYVE